MTPYHLSVQLSKFNNASLYYYAFLLYIIPLVCIQHYVGQILHNFDHLLHLSAETIVDISHNIYTRWSRVKVANSQLEGLWFKPQCWQHLIASYIDGDSLY